MLSLIKQDITGKEADAWLGAAHITVNKNSVPNDPRSPFVTSGIRIGTPAVTTRGFGEAEVRELAGWIADILDAKGDEAVIKTLIMDAFLSVIVGIDPSDVKQDAQSESREEVFQKAFTHFISDLKH